MGNRKCDDTIALVYPYLDGEITWWRRRRVRMHLRNCKDCPPAFEFEEQLKLMVRRKTHTDPPDEMLDRLRDYLRDNE